MTCSRILPYSYPNLNHTRTYCMDRVCVSKKFVVDVKCTCILHINKKEDKDQE